jgi:hypothetical protein
VVLEPSSECWSWRWSFLEMLPSVNDGAGVGLSAVGGVVRGAVAVASPWSRLHRSFLKPSLVGVELLPVGLEAVSG